MALAKVTNQRETDKFVLNSSDETAIRTVSETKETAPTDDSKNNGSMLISYNAAGDAVYVDEIISGVTYRQTFTRSDMAVASTLPISAVEII